MKVFLLSLVICFFSISYAQTGKVSGRVYSATNNESLPFFKVLVVDQQKGAVCLEDGTFVIENLNPGVYSFKATSAGYQELILNDITITNARTVELNFALEPIIREQKEVTVKAKPFQKVSESPVSLRTLNATEIERQPGRFLCRIFGTMTVLGGCVLAQCLKRLCRITGTIV